MSIVRHPYLLNKEPSESEEKREVDTTIGHSNRNIFSVVKFSGTQFKVTLVRRISVDFLFLFYNYNLEYFFFNRKDDVIVADKIEGIDIGDDIHVEEVKNIHYTIYILKH